MTEPAAHLRAVLQRPEIARIVRPMHLHRETVAPNPITVRPAVVRATLPDAVTLREALQHPATTLCREFGLRDATVATDRAGLPLVYTGRFAAVFRLTLSGGSRAALRVFTSPDVWNERAERAERLAQSLREREGQIGDLLPPFLVVPNAVRIGEAWHDAHLLPWADGQSLLSFLEAHHADAGAMTTLAATVADAVARLAACGVSHGDIQHDNLFVRDGGRGITFVDYDAVTTPELAGFAPPAERGHPNYQPPHRVAGENGLAADRFAASVIRAGLLLLAESPDAWERFGGDTGEGVLFTATDFAAPDVSPVFAAATDAAKHSSALAEAVVGIGDWGLGVRTEGLAAKPFGDRETSLPLLPTGYSLIPTRVSPTCAEEVPRPVSYLAPLSSPVFRERETAHFAALRAFLVVAPPVVLWAWLAAWNAGGSKWPFLAYLLLILATISMMFLHLTWGVKRQRDALELEAGKLREAERTDRERERRVRYRLERMRGVPAPDPWQERNHLRRALAQIPLSRAIGDAGVSADAVRGLRERGVASAASLWERHGFLPTGTAPEVAAGLRAWLATVEMRERERYARDTDPSCAAREELARLADRRIARQTRLAQLAAEREAFPEAGFAAFLRAALRFRSPMRRHAC